MAFVTVEVGERGGEDCALSGGEPMGCPRGTTPSP